ncbi:MAG: flagellar filament capping protein FliD, partial [Terriglobales bacterium]
LSSLGITVNTDGTLAVNNTTLQNALSGNFAAVQNFFQGASGTVGSNLSAVLTQLTAPGTGPLTVELNNLSTQGNDLTTQINQINAQLAVQQQQLTEEYSQVNATLQTLPLLLQQINGQLGSLGGSTSSSTSGSSSS